LGPRSRVIVALAACIPTAFCIVMATACYVVHVTQRAVSQLWH